MSRRPTAKDLIRAGILLEKGNSVAEIKKKSKYGNKIVHSHGKKFDSKKEYGRWLELKQMQDENKIRDLVHHKVYSIDINGRHIANYEADFVYWRPHVFMKRDGQTIVEDVKSEITRRNPVYRLKKKLMAAVHGINIVEV